MSHAWVWIFEMLNAWLLSQLKVQSALERQETDHYEMEAARTFLTASKRRRCENDVSTRQREIDKNFESDSDLVPFSIDNTHTLHWPWETKTGSLLSHRCSQCYWLHWFCARIHRLSAYPVTFALGSKLLMMAMISFHRGRYLSQNDSENVAWLALLTSNNEAMICFVTKMCSWGILVKHK